MLGRAVPEFRTSAGQELSPHEAIFLNDWFFRIAKGIGNARNHFDHRVAVVGFGRMAGLAV
jgi:hypothetical protein